MKMPPQPSTDQALRAENTELRLRLQEAEELLRANCADTEKSRLHGAMLAQVSEAVIATDLEDRITFLNSAAEQQYRVRSADVLGRKLSELYTCQWPSPESEAAAWAALEERGHWCGRR